MDGSRRIHPTRHERLLTLPWLHRSCQLNDKVLPRLRPIVWDRDRLAGGRHACAVEGEVSTAKLESHDVPVRKGDCNCGNGGRSSAVLRKVRNETPSRSRTL